MPIVIGKGCLFKFGDNLKTESVPINLPSSPSAGKNNYDRSVRLSGDVVHEAVNVKDGKYRGTFPPISYRLLPVAISTWDELDPNAQRLISEFVGANVYMFGYAEDEEG